MNHMMEKTISCPICGVLAGYAVRYEANFDPRRLDFAARKDTAHMHFRYVVCDGCGLIYSNPIIEDAAIVELYRISNFIDEPHLDNMIKDYVAEVDKIVHLLPRRGKMLEVGCANGLFLKAAKKYGFDECWGVEPGQAAVAAAPPEISRQIINDILKQGQFASHSFDLICSFQVFDHVIDPNDFLRQIKSYLRPGGLFIQVHHNIDSPLPALLGSRASTYDVEHIHLWNPSTMRLILAKNGFVPLKIRNLWSRYQADHALRMLPLPVGLKSVVRRAARLAGIANLTIRAPVENMVIVSRNGDVG